MTIDQPLTESVITVEHDGHVAILWLDRPAKRNALGMPFFEQLPLAMRALGDDSNVRAVVLAARGPAFSVGLDLAALAGIAGEGTLEDGPSQRPSSPAAAGRSTHRSVLRLQSSISSVAECPKPVIAAIHGYCIGGGIDLTSACDIRVCSADATFSVRETRMAIVADIGTLARLPLLMPFGSVAELVYTGKDFDAEAAQRMGFVNAVLPDPSATLAAAKAMAHEIAANSPFAVQGSKAVLSEIHRDQVTRGLHFVAAWNAGQLRSNDLTEAVTAFFEKRPPNFAGD